ncbi:16494_t:CDS:2, partial [Acaulospora colombiana]
KKMELYEATALNELEDVFMEIQSVFAKENELQLRLEELLAERRRRAEEKLEEAKRHLKEVEEDENMRRVKLVRPTANALDPARGQLGEESRNEIDTTNTNSEKNGDPGLISSHNNQPCSACERVKEVGQGGTVTAEDVKLIELFIPDLTNNITWKKGDRMKLMKALTRTVELTSATLNRP